MHQQRENGVFPVYVNFPLVKHPICMLPHPGQQKRQVHRALHMSRSLRKNLLSILSYSLGSTARNYSETEYIYFAVQRKRAYGQRRWKGKHTYAEHVSRRSAIATNRSFRERRLERASEQARGVCSTRCSFDAHTAAKRGSLFVVVVPLDYIL